MIFSVGQQELLEGLKSVKLSVAKTGLQPILTMVKIETVAGGIKLTTTDLYNTTVYSCVANVKEKGEVCIPFNKLYSVVEKLTGYITVELVDSLVKIKGGRTKFDIVSVGTEEFPAVSETLDYTFKVLVNREDFSNALKRVSFALLQGENGILTGINFIFKDGTLELCATDGNRLSVTTIDYVGNNYEKTFVCPSKVVEFIKTNGENVEVQLDSKNNIVFASDNVVYKTRTIEGVYPQYQALIPKAFERIVTVNKEDLLKAIERVAIIADDKTKIVKLKFLQDDLTLSAVMEGNAAEDTIEVKSNIEEEFTIGFNYGYLLDCLRASNTSEITIEMNGALGAVLINSDFVGLVMPLQMK
jgi:DNA polymerase-3 subunit beta